MKRTPFPIPNNHADYELDPSPDRIGVKFDRPPAAGRYVTFKVTVVLAEPLEAGQGLAVFSPFGFTPPQLRTPSAAGFVTVSGPAGAELKLTHYLVGKVKRERGVIAWPVTTGLKRGSRLVFTFGDRSRGGPGSRVSLVAHQGLLVAGYRLRSQEEAAPPLLAKSPRIGVRPDRGALVRGFVTPVLAAGEEGRLQLVAEDRFGNRADDFRGEVRLRGVENLAGLPDKVVFKPADRGRRELSFRPRRTGCFTPVVVSARADHLAGPVEVTERPPEYRLYFGELHAHTELSQDGAGSLDEFYAFARSAAGLDFAAATDHQLPVAGMPGYASHASGLPNTSHARYPDRWRATAEAARRHHQPGRFVTFLGFEFNTSGNAGHRNLYFKGDEPEIIEAPAWPLPERFLQSWAGQRRDIMVVPHHPAICFSAGVYTTYKGLEIGVVDERIQPLVEIYSKHGTSEYFNNPRPLRGQAVGHFVQDMLEAGAHFGLVGGSDGHQANPGSSLEEPGWFRTLQYRSGLAAVWARELTREALWEAFFARRVYATTYPRVILRFQVNDLFMGAIGPAAYPRRIKIFVASPILVNYLEVIKNGRVVFMTPEQGQNHPIPPEVEGELEFVDETPSDRVEDYYYLRLTLHGSERVWSSPVWVSNQ